MAKKLNKQARLEALVGSEPDNYVLLHDYADLSPEKLMNRLRQLHDAGAFAGSKRMDPAIKKRWLKELRSGKYLQITGQLREEQSNGEGFCCLGVLCNVHAQMHPKIAALETNPERYLGEEGTLPAKVMKWARINEANGAFQFLGEKEKLYELNDNYDWNFEQIACVISIVF